MKLTYSIHLDNSKVTHVSLRSDLTHACLFHQVYPLTGPLEGGTLLTLQGTNLGRKRQQVLNAVTVGGEPCTLKSYQISKQLSGSMHYCQISLYLVDLIGTNNFRKVKNDAL